MCSRASTAITYGVDSLTNLMLCSSTMGCRDPCHCSKVSSVSLGILFRVDVRWNVFLQVKDVKGKRPVYLRALAWFGEKLCSYTQARPSA